MKGKEQGSMKGRERKRKTEKRFILLRNFSVAISVSPHACLFLVLILISLFLT